MVQVQRLEFFVCACRYACGLCAQNLDHEGIRSIYFVAARLKLLYQLLQLNLGNLNSTLRARLFAFRGRLFTPRPHLPAHFSSPFFTLFPSSLPLPLSITHTMHTCAMCVSIFRNFLLLFLYLLFKTLCSVIDRATQVFFLLQSTP